MPEPDRQNRPKAIIFDLDATLTDRRASIALYADRFARAFSNALSAVDRSAERVHEVIWSCDGCGYTPRAEVCRQLIDRLQWDQPLNCDQLHAFWRSEFPRCTVPRDGLLSILQWLGDSGIVVAVLSNGNSSMQRRKLEALDIGRYLHSVFISEEIGTAKPDPAIFNFALKKLAIAPSDAWYVGDHPANDIGGATRASMTTIWIEGVFEWPADLQRPVRSIRELMEIVPMIEAEWVARDKKDR